MKKITIRNLLVGFIVISAMILSSCSKSDEPDPNTYVPEVRGLISKDNGNKWMQNMKDIKVGEVFYLRFDVSIKQNKLLAFGKGTKLGYSIAIPATEVLECNLTDFTGKVDTVPIADQFSNITRYDFSAVASKKPKKYQIIFKCKALATGTHRLVVSFDENVDDVHTQNFTMVYR